MTKTSDNLNNTDMLEELTDEDLEKVSGGGKGWSPEGGVRAEPYDWIRTGYYYVKNPHDLTYVIYVYEMYAQGEKAYYYYSSEKFNIKPDGSWSTQVLIDKASISYTDITRDYKYRLNVVPWKR